MSLGNKIKQAINTEESDTVNLFDKEDAVKREKQMLALKRLEKVISQIKTNISEMANDKRNIKKNKSGNVIVTNTKEIFGHDIYDKDTLSSYRGEIEFFAHYKKSEFHETLTDFKLWLISNDIDKIIISWTHCGGGRSEWNIYSAKIF